MALPGLGLIKLEAPYVLSFIFFFIFIYLHHSKGTKVRFRSQKPRGRTGGILGERITRIEEGLASTFLWRLAQHKIAL